MTDELEDWRYPDIVNLGRAYRLQVERTMSVLGGKNSREKYVAPGGSAAILSVIFSMLTLLISWLSSLDDSETYIM